MSSFYKIIFTVFVSSVLLSSCKKDKDVPDPTPSGPNYTVPTTYNGFSNVDHKDETAVLNQMTSIDNLTKTGTTTTLDAATLKAMYKGQTGPVNLESLTSSYTAQSLIESYFDSIAIASQSYANTSPSKGVAGVGAYTTTSSSGTKTSYYLLSGKGINYQQLISKAMFGVVLYNQIIQKLSEQSIGNSVDNNVVYADQGTLMEHHWDEAFGYFGVPDSFPTVTTGSKYLGSYSNQINPGTGSNAIIMNAFLKGRAAISNKDMATKQAQADIIINQLEILLAASAIHEINELKGVTNSARINSVLSESMGFIIGLKYSPRKKITTAQADLILSYFGSNMYDITQTDLNNIVNTIATVYGFSNPSGI